MKYILLILLFITYLTGQSQSKNPLGYWCVYHPFEEGLQMVEIKFGISDLSLLAHWDHTTTPNRDIYLIRNETGKITAIFNACGTSLSDYTILPPREVPEDIIQPHQQQEYYISENCKKIKGREKYADFDYSNAKYGLINTKGEITIPPVYEYLNKAGNFYVVSNGTKYGIINAQQEIVIPYEIDQRPDVYGSHYPIVLSINHQFVYFDKENGQILSAGPYDYAQKFWSGRALVKSDNKFGFIDSTGAEVVPLIYDKAESFYYTIAIVGQQGANGIKYGIVDNQGRQVQPLIYDRIEPITGDHLGISCIGYIAYINQKEIQINLRGEKAHANSRFFYGKNNFIDFTKIEYGERTFCEKPIIQEIQIDGQGAKEIVVYRKCLSNTDAHGGTYDITENYEIDKYEIWNLDSRELLFEATSKYYINYNKFNVYADPQHAQGQEGYTYDFQINEEGVITIKNVQPFPNPIDLDESTEGSDQQKSKKNVVQPDHKEGTYQYINGQYQK